MNYETLTGDLENYHEMAIAAIDWAITFQKPNGGIAGGMTTWDVPGVWTEEVWTGTEHNIDAYPALIYFAQTTPGRSEAYMTAAVGVLVFLENVVWDETNQRFYGGYKNNTGLVDPYVPLDVNPWAVLALGSDYAATLAYVENAAGDPLTGIGTLEHPKYVQTLTYDDGGNLMTGYDFDWQDDGAAALAQNGGGTYAADIWIEGTIFMACAYGAVGDADKAASILTEVVKKMGAAGSMAGGLPYSLKASNNHYWRMLQQNCVSSTAWFVIAAAAWNPFQATELDPTDRAAIPESDLVAGQYPDAVTVTLTSSTAAAVIRYTTDGTLPDETSALYTGPIDVTTDMTIRAITIADGYRVSKPGEWTYIIDSQARQPEFSLASGIYAGTQTITIGSVTDGAEIRYTLDGTLPTTASTLYEGPFAITADQVITAVCLRPDLDASDYVRVTYQIVEQTEAPLLSLASGSYDGPQTVTVSAVNDAIVHFTVDGSEPTTASPIWTGPLMVTGDLTVKVAAIVPGCGLSAVVSAEYSVNVSGMPYSWTETSQTATVSYLEAFVYVDIHYLVNGGGQQNVRMIVNSVTGHPETVISGLSSDDVVTFWFTVMVAEQTDTPHYEITFGEIVPVSGTVDTPSADKSAGTYEEILTVLLSSTTEGAEIRYLINGDTSAG